MATEMTSKYDQQVDPSAPNNAHAYALELVGWNRRVLELGAASGHVTRALVAQRCKVTSVEVDADAAKGLEGVADEVVIGDLNDPQTFSGLKAEYDTVLAGDVLEHLLRPHEILTRAARLLKPGGQVVISLPHVGHADIRLSLIRGSWDYRPFGLLDDSHIRFFTLKAIKDLMREAGLVITDLRRVRIPAFETELPVDRASIPTDVLELVLADPEAETYQFVFSATNDTGDLRLRRQADRNIELESELDRLRIAHGALRGNYETAREASQEAVVRAQQSEQALATLQAEHSSLQAEHASVRAEHGALMAENQVLDRFNRRVAGSVTWQMFQRLRGGVFAFLGGERSRRGRMLQAMIRLIGRPLGRRDTAAIPEHRRDQRDNGGRHANAQHQNGARPVIEDLETASIGLVQNGADRIAQHEPR